MIKLINIINEIMREDMPQIKGKDFPEMLRLFKTYEVPYRLLNMRVYDLKPTQDDVIPKKVDAIVKSIKNGKEMPPLLISSDEYIIDGHNRWCAFKQIDPESIIKVCRIGFPKMIALQLMNKTEDIIKK